MCEFCFLVHTNFRIYLIYLYLFGVLNGRLYFHAEIRAKIQWWTVPKNKMYNVI